MQITVKGKNFDITSALESHAKQKVTKTERYSDGIISAEFILKLERTWHVAEVTLFGKGFDMHAEEKSKDMYNSIDRVVEKLERMLKKQREKVVSHRGGRGLEGKPETDDDEAPRQPRRAEDPYAARIESIHRFVPQTISIDEAIKEMEAADYQFLCFINEHDGLLSIVHKKGRGYGLLVPNIED